MCERYSWLEVNGKTVFLTGRDVFHTKRGKDLRQYSQRPEDWCGHGVIRRYYDISSDTGTEHECIDFSTPASFPAEIVKAIKAGEMWELGITRHMLAMLGRSARTKYNKVHRPAYAEYNKDYIALQAEYCQVCEVARTKYNKINDATSAKSYKACSKARDKRNKAYNKAYDKFDKAYKAACAKRDKACSTAFADLFSNLKNRVREWR